MELSNATLASPSGSEPSVRLMQVKMALIQGCHNREKVQTWMEIKGRETEQISVIGNDLGKAERAIDARYRRGQGCDFSRSKSHVTIIGRTVDFTDRACLKYVV